MLLFYSLPRCHRTGFCKYGHTVKISVVLRLCAAAPIQLNDSGLILATEDVHTRYNRSVSSRRFRELQDEFFAASTRLQLAQKPEEKLELLNELQRIVQVSKRELVDTDSKKR